MDRTVKLVLAYDGAAYQGWQRQPDRPTVQGAVEAAIQAVTRVRSPVHGSGRTDAGVHAIGQVCHFRTACGLPAETLVRALNANLPEDVAVRAAADAPADFHARYSAVRKTYFYQAYVDAHRDPLRRRRALHLRRPPDLGAMRRAAAHLVGRHDFRSFATEAPPDLDTVRTMFALRIVGTPRGFRIFATSNGFLQHMVRSIAGCLLRVGMGRDDPSEPARILAARDRREAPAALPAHALFLWRVDY
ncbi:MAG: tRNA pseudouridine(38-40) synthase TruA [Planctomycetota bacterium JB042]